MDLVRTIAQTIYDNKGFNIMALDIREISNLTDTFLIAEGNVSQHIKGLAAAIREAIVDQPSHVEGLAEGDWVVLDYGEVIVHLFVSEMRERYRLEQLWHDGTIIDLQIIVNKAVN